LRLVGRFPRLRVLVVGDFMLDQFIWGTVNRISPEAPVPVVRMTGEDYRAGGAGNVVNNIRALGSRATACGLVGSDRNARELVRVLRAVGADVSGLMATRGAVTTQKTRIIAHQQQVVRVDRETGDAPEARTVGRLSRYVLGQVGRHAAVIISDYGKGAVSARLLGELAARQERDAFLWVIDPKRPNFAHYRNASLVKPNLEEASAASGIEIVDVRSLAAAGRRLLEIWNAEAILISRGEDGMSLFKRHGEIRHFPTAARDVYDVTGAGDTAVAACALTMAAGGSLEEATVMANVAAGVAVAHVGTIAVTGQALRAAIRRAQGDGTCAA
jgi:D-beta-D-heptose 7-phosphate kinase/D-beta-D-heptose 1-phosphate adenosyltransferase